MTTLQFPKVSGSQQVGLVIFVLMCQTVWASSDVLLLYFAAAGIWIAWTQPAIGPLNRTQLSTLWVSLGFCWVFIIKMVSMAWALHPLESLDNAFNHLHFLLWPALIPFLRRADMNPSAVEPWLGCSMVILALWYFVMRFFLLAENISDWRFEGGVNSYGMLSTTMGFFTLWLIVAWTRPGQSRAFRWGMSVSTLAALVVLFGTRGRTELLGVALGGALVLAWRLRHNMGGKTGVVLLALAMVFGLSTVFAEKARFQMIGDEVNTYFGGHEERLQSIHTSIGGRLEMYRIALEAIEERPILGWGAGLKPRHFPQFATDPEQPFAYRNFHSLFLQSLLEIGLIGSMVSLLVGIFLFRQTVWRLVIDRNEELALLVLVLWFSYLWKSLLNATFGYGLPNAVFVLFSAWFWVEATRSQQRIGR